MEESGEKKHGGRRPGAGRKRTRQGKYYGFNSTFEAERILESIPSSKTHFINEAVVYYAEYLERMRISGDCATSNVPQHCKLE